MRTQSQNIEAERALLCSLLLEAPPSGDRELFDIYRERVDESVFSLVEADDFFDKRNAKIFKAIKQVIERGVTPDFITVSEALQDLSLRSYLIGLTEFLPAPINLREYAKIVKKHSLQRQADALSAKRRVLRQELVGSDDDEKIRGEIETLLQQEIEINRQILDLSESLAIRKFTGQTVRRPILRCNGLLPEGHVSMLAGSAATGKTYIALSFAALYILETRKPALIWLSEDLSETEYRIGQMLEKVPLWRDNKDLIIDKLRYVEDIPDPLLIKEFGALDVDIRALNRLKRYVQDFGFILLDPLTDFFGQDENNNTAARRFMNVLKKLVFGTDKIILLTHHTNKADILVPDNLQEIDVFELRRKIRGASAFIDAPRTTLYLLHNISIKTQNGLVGKYLVNIKSNVAKTGVVTDEMGKPVAWELPFTGDSVEGNLSVISGNDDDDGGIL